tara:strand:+ start:4520 stop:4744 length:225 start_codon:yes stop_codon:yes gene_type:complete
METVAASIKLLPFIVTKVFTGPFIGLNVLTIGAGQSKLILELLKLKVCIVVKRIIIVIKKKLFFILLVYWVKIE